MYIVLDYVYSSSDQVITMTTFYNPKGSSIVTRTPTLRLLEL